MRRHSDYPSVSMYLVTIASKNGFRSQIVVLTAGIRCIQNFKLYLPVEPIRVSDSSPLTQ